MAITSKMINTGFHLSEYELDELAVPYLFYMGKYIPLPQYDIRIPGSGGVRSTINDLAHFLIMHTNNGVFNDKRILKKESVDEMHCLQYPTFWDEKYRYGLGWYKRKRDDQEPYSGHDGAVTGFRNVMRMHEEEKVGVIFFYNRFHYFHFREKHRLVGKLEKWVRNKIEELLFEKAGIFLAFVYGDSV